MSRVQIREVSPSNHRSHAKEQDIQTQGAWERGRFRTCTIAEGLCFYMSTCRPLFTGQHELRSARLGWDIPPDDLYTTHHNPTYFPVIHTLLYHNKMRVIQIGFTRCSVAAYLVLPILPLIWIATAIEARHSIKRSRQGGLDLLRWLIHCNHLFSDKLIVCSQKSEPSTSANVLPSSVQS
jgi:hypothetical protein